MKIVKPISYQLPEGIFKGKIISADLKEDTKHGKIRDSVRLTLAADPIKGDPLHDYRARVDYWASQGEEFLEDAYKLLGQKVSELTDADGEIIQSKLCLLEGKRVEFTVEHSFRPGHVNPFCKVLNLRPDEPQTEEPAVKRAA